MWRPARAEEDELVVALCLELYREDPGAFPVTAAQARRTLELLRREPSRGQAVVVEAGGRPVGYALLISFWSNELGGELCQIDELFVASGHRSQGLGSRLFEQLERGELWPGPLVALGLGVTPGNARARRLYERLGFAAVGTSMVRRCRASPGELGVGTTHPTGVPP